MKTGFKVKLLSFLLATVMLIGIQPMTTFASEDCVTNYSDFLVNLKVLETYADEYAAEIVGRDPAELVVNFIRTGVERYLDDNWVTLAGQEIVGFTNYVANQDAERGTTAMYLRNIVTSNFTLPNGNPVDFGHMFGCMNISYVNAGSADLSGWAGDLCDLLYYSVNYGKVEGETVDEMAAYIVDNCFGVDASDAFGWDDFYGDMDAYYLINEYKNGAGKFSEIMESYFTEDLSDKDRAVYFVNNRFGVEDTKEAVRKALYESYSSDVGIKILESKRGLSSYVALREASCYALADYLFSVAGGQGLFVPGSGDNTTVDNGYYSVFSDEESILAPGIKQNIKYAQTVDSKQIVYYIATVDVARDDVILKANYRDNDPSKGWGLQTVEQQTAALVKKYQNMVDENGNKLYENFNAIVATNGDGYNIYNGTPGGLLVMDGTEWHGVDRDGFFAIIETTDENGKKIDKAIIGTQAEYETYKDQIKEAIGGFGAVLVKDGKINVTKNANYTAARASRTAIGVTASGEVVMMVLDGRQQPFSAGGAMEEIAQIMLEAGCVHAINLDGGGSTTFLSKPAGSDSLQLTNRPSDGYQRQVATSLAVISTAKPSNAFDKAIISSDYDYITAGTSMQISVVGVSNTGNKAEIPAGAYWTVSDESVGTINSDGVFTAVSDGDVTVSLMIDGVAVGTKELHVVIPDDIKFAEDKITAIYGKPLELSLTLWYEGNPVAFNMETNVFIILEEGKESAGTIDGVTFIGNEESGIRSVMVIGVLALESEELAAFATINMYRHDEATFDFDNATQGNRALAWNREVLNTKTLDDMLYRIVDPDEPIDIEYTFALDMTAIEMPAQLEPLKSMLPEGTNPESSAWDFLLSLAERVCIQTNVTIRAEFSKDLDVDISNLEIVTDYFELTSVNLDADNVLTLVCNWKDQTQAIDPATANPLCILNGITARVKDTASYYNNELAIANNGTVSYDIYLAASSLHSFASDEANQQTYGLYPYIHEPGCRIGEHDSGGHFSSQYVDFADIYVINSEVRQGWIEDSYYVDNEAVTGIQLVPDRHDATQMRFCEFDENGILVNEQGITGLITFEDELYYPALGIVRTGWYEIDGDFYYFHPDTGAAVDGKFTIRENKNSWSTADFEYEFEDHVLVKGVWMEDSQGDYSGRRYRWAGDWILGEWFEVDGKLYYADKDEFGYVRTGYQHYIPSYENTNVNKRYLFDELGALRNDYIGPADVVANGTPYSWFFKDGTVYTTKGIIMGTDGYFYFVYDDATYAISKNQWVGIADNGADWSHGLIPAGKTYSFDEYGRLIDPLVSVSTTDSSLDTTYSVAGNVIIVDHSVPCKIGYLVDGKYVGIEAVDNGDGTYKFVAPAGVTAVKMVINGDVNSDGVVDSADSAALTKSLLPNVEDLTGVALFAADINGNGKVNSADRVLIARSLLDESHKMYKPLEW